MIFVIRNDGINSGNHSPRLSGLVIPFFLQKLLMQCAGSNKMGEEVKVPCLVSDATGNDVRMNAEALRWLDNGQRRWVVLYLARIPYVFGNEPILAPFIRFGFSRIASRALHVTKTQIIDERFIARPAQIWRPI